MVSESRATTYAVLEIGRLLTQIDMSLVAITRSLGEIAEVMKESRKRELSKDQMEANRFSYMTEFTDGRVFNTRAQVLFQEAREAHDLKPFPKIREEVWRDMDGQGDQEAEQARQAHRMVEQINRQQQAAERDTTIADPKDD